MSQEENVNAETISEYQSLTNDQILDYEYQLQQEEKQRTGIIISELLALTQLQQEYGDGNIMMKKIENLPYIYYRGCRRDGNCFYRALAYTYFERLWKKRKEAEFIIEHEKQKIANMKVLLDKAGFQALVYEDYIDLVLEQMEIIHVSDDIADVARIFNEEYISDGIVVLFRLITSAYLREHAQEYEMFLESPFTSMDNFVTSHVENMGEESDMIHIIAITKAMQLQVKIVYLDLSDRDRANVHDFAPDEQDDIEKKISAENDPITLLYRPGHYDILV